MGGIGNECGSFSHSVTHGIPGIEGAMGHVDILHSGLHAAKVYVGLGHIVADVFVSIPRVEDIAAKGGVQGGGELGAEGLVPGARALVPAVLIASLVIPRTTYRGYSLL